MKPLRYFVIFAAVAGLLFVAHLFGVWVALGGHPYWSASATYFGIGIGGAISLLALWLGRDKPSLARWLVILFAVVALVSLGVSTFGKREFVASYAEDRLAGSFWYFGFMAFVGGVFATCAQFLAGAGFGRSP